MQNTEIDQIVIIGSGNVATHYALALANAGVSITQIVGRKAKGVKSLAKRIGCNYTTDFKQIEGSAGMYLLAINDDAIARVIERFPYKNKIMVHTAASVDASVFGSKTNHYGVMYPLQSLSKDIPIDFNSVPLLVEGNTEELTDSLITLAGKMTNKVQYADGNMRLSAHVSAVFVNNFVNHLWALAQQLAVENGVDPRLFEPLMAETARKALLNPAEMVQTGPALRGDYKTIERHMNLIESPQLKNIYKSLTDSIINMYNTDDAL